GPAHGAPLPRPGRDGLLRGDARPAACARAHQARAHLELGRGRRRPDVHEARALARRRTGAVARGRGRHRRVIVDAHLHAAHLPALGWKLDAAECVRRMDEAGIERGVVMTIVDAPEVNPGALELLVDACAEFPGRLEAFARIHPWYGDEA